MTATMATSALTIVVDDWFIKLMVYTITPLFRYYRQEDIIHEGRVESGVYYHTVKWKHSRDTEYMRSLRDNKRGGLTFVEFNEAAKQLTLSFEIPR